MPYLKRRVFVSLAIALFVPTSIGISTQLLPVAQGTRLLLRLQDELSSKTSRRGDRFSAVVISAGAYRGAVVEGHISHLEESGRLKGKTEMALDFDRIRLRNGREARFSAEMLELRQNESVKVVDEEGVIHSGSRGKQAIKRSAIGAAIGGVIGGLIGGRKGVAIGLIIGAGAGAGSLIVDGNKELKLERGAEILVRTLSTVRSTKCNSCT